MKSKTERNFMYQSAELIYIFFKLRNSNKIFQYFTSKKSYNSFICVKNSQVGSDSMLAKVVGRRDVTSTLMVENLWLMLMLMLMLMSTNGKMLDFGGISKVLEDIREECEINSWFEPLRENPRSNYKKHKWK